MVLPVLFRREVGDRCEFQVCGLDLAFDMDVGALGSLRTETKHVVGADGSTALVMVKLADHACFAESSLEVGTWLLLLVSTALIWLRVSKDTVGLVLAVPVVLEEGADRDALLVINMKILALVSFFAATSHPVDTNILLAFTLVNFVGQRLGDGFKLVNGELGLAVSPILVGNTSVKLPVRRRHLSPLRIRHGLI